MPFSSEKFASFPMPPPNYSVPCFTHPFFPFYPENPTVRFPPNPVVYSSQTNSRLDWMASRSYKVTFYPSQYGMCQYVQIFQPRVFRIDFSGITYRPATSG